MRSTTDSQLCIFCAGTGGTGKNADSPKSNKTGVLPNDSTPVEALTKMMWASPHIRKK